MSVRPPGGGGADRRRQAPTKGRFARRQEPADGGRGSTPLRRPGSGGRGCVGSDIAPGHPARRRRPRHHARRRARSAPHSRSAQGAVMTRHSSRGSRVSPSRWPGAHSVPTSRRGVFVAMIRPRWLTSAASPATRRERRAGDRLDAADRDVRAGHAEERAVADDRQRQRQDVLVRAAVVDERPGDPALAGVARGRVPLGLLVVVEVGVARVERRVEEHRRAGRHAAPPLEPARGVRERRRARTPCRRRRAAAAARAWHGRATGSAPARRARGASGSASTASAARRSRRRRPRARRGRGRAPRRLLRAGGARRARRAPAAVLAAPGRPGARRAGAGAARPPRPSRPRRAPPSAPRAASASRARTAASTARWSASARPGPSAPAASHTSAPTSVCSSISARVSRSERVVAAISTWKRASAARRSPGARRARQPLDVLAEPLEVGVGRPLGRQPRRRAGDRRAVVGEVAQLVDAQLGEPLEQPRLRRLGRRVHERAAVAAAARLDQPGAPQADERLAQRDGRHAELGGELGLGGQLVAVAEHAARGSRRDEPPLHLGHPPALVERREHGVARARRQMARHRGLTDYIWLHRFFRRPCRRAKGDVA